MCTQFFAAVRIWPRGDITREAGLSQPIFRRIFINPRRVGPQHEPEVQRAIAAAQAVANGHDSGSPEPDGEQLQPMIIRIHMVGVPDFTVGSRPTLH